MRATVATITVIVALFGGAGPATADDLVTNITQLHVASQDLSANEILQAFRTGSNASGYRLEPISIHFSSSGRIENSATGQREPVYVYVQKTGAGQVAELTKNGINFAGPVAGVNKYKVWKARCYPQPPHGGGCLSDASSVHLDPNTTYWVYVWAGESDSSADVSVTTQVETGAAGWSIADTVRLKPQTLNRTGIFGDWIH